VQGQERSGQHDSLSSSLLCLGRPFLLMVSVPATLGASKHWPYWGTLAGSHVPCFLL
jgi:hypothetical protein